MSDTPSVASFASPTTAPTLATPVVPAATATIPPTVEAIPTAVSTAPVALTQVPSAIPTPTEPLPTATAALLPPTPAPGPLRPAQGGTSDLTTSSQQTQRNSEGSATVAPTWKNPGSGAGQFDFSVVMDTHSVGLDGYDLERLAVLRTDVGQEVSPASWDGAAGGQHRSGGLSFPTAGPSGEPLIGPGTRYIEVVVRKVAGVEERVFHWDISA